jgi:uncharacterized protein
LDVLKRTIVTPPLLDAIRGQYRLDWNGIHGIGHWQRVHLIGARIAEAAGADPQVVELFAYLHDACRRNEHIDPEHGLRAVELAKELRGKHFELPQAKFEALCRAMEGHTRGGLASDVDIGACWDADRLDLGRVHITTRTELLSLAASREQKTFDWAKGLYLSD